MKNKIINLAIVGVLFAELLSGTSPAQAQTLNQQSAVLASMIQVADSFTKLLASITSILTNQSRNNPKQATTTQKAKEILEIIQAQIETLKTIVEENKGTGEGSAISQTAQGIGPTVRQISQTLRPGNTGQDVITLQEYLSSQDNIYPEKLVTGYYGPLTTQAVINFQRKVGLEPVGVVNPETLAVINQQLAEQASVATDNLIDNNLTPPALSLREYTVSLLNIANELKQAPAEKKPAIAARLAEYARMRKEAILREIAKDPKAVLDNALSNSIIASFPSNIQPLLEQEVTIRGKFKAIHFDNIDGTSRFEFSITDETTGKSYGLHFANNRYPNALTDDRVQVHGVKVDGEIALADGSTSVTTLAATSPTILPDTFGPKKTLVMLINFPGNTAQPFTVATAQNVMNTTSNFFKENSFNQAWLTGVIDTTQAADVTNWMTITSTSTTCDYHTWASQAESAAAAAGYNLASYSRYVYVFPGGTPGGSTCSFWGVGTLGGNPARSWINAGFGFVLQVVGHEMGHNFGLRHSKSQSCASGGCTVSEYGDVYDIMDSTVGHFNAFQKSRLGWLNYSISPPITYVTNSGIYTIAPYETNDMQPKALQILKSSGTTNTYYYVEYRAGLGFDSGKTAVIVHSTDYYSYLWDLDQITTVSDWVLNVGQTYQDATAGISITNLSQDATGAKIGVTLGPIVCVPNNPSLTFSPSSVSVFAGQSASFNYTLTNNDTPSCPSSNFSIKPTLPAGFNQSPSSISYTLSPGESVSGSLIISTPTDVAPGSYSIIETAQNMSTTTVYKSATTLTMTVLPPDTTPPTVTIISPADGTTVSKGNVTISASASDASGISEIRIFIDGGLIKTCYNTTSCSGRVNANGLTTGAHTITAQATDKGGPVANVNSASITIIKK
jgi:hypothetical protein